MSAWGNCNGTSLVDKLRSEKAPVPAAAAAAATATIQVADKEKLFHAADAADAAPAAPAAVPAEEKTVCAVAPAASHHRGAQGSGRRGKANESRKGAGKAVAQSNSTDEALPRANGKGRRGAGTTNGAVLVPVAADVAEPTPTFAIPVAPADPVAVGGLAAAFAQPAAPATSTPPAAPTGAPSEPPALTSANSKTAAAQADDEMPLVELPEALRSLVSVDGFHFSAPPQQAQPSRMGFANMHGMHPHQRGPHGLHQHNFGVYGVQQQMQGGQQGGNAQGDQSTMLYGGGMHHHAMSHHHNMPFDCYSNYAVCNRGTNGAPPVGSVTPTSGPSANGSANGAASSNAAGQNANGQAGSSNSTGGRQSQQMPPQYGGEYSNHYQGYSGSYMPYHGNGRRGQHHSPRGANGGYGTGYVDQGYYAQQWHHGAMMPQQHVHQQSPPTPQQQPVQAEGLQ